jgi:hypothetical protein
MVAKTMKSFPIAGDLHGWSDFLRNGQIHILASTQDSLSSLKLKDDTLLPGELSVVVLRDPLFALAIIKHLQEHRNKLRTVDITTIEHALMMLGVEPFFKLFGGEPTLEEILDNKEASKQAIHAVARRSYVASRLAQDWAAKAKDIESEELQVAALIHDVAEMLLWMKAPAHAFLIKKHMQEDPQLRSHNAQLQVLGISLVDVEVEICKDWGLPTILLNLLLGREKTPRMTTVALAVRLARHCASSWDNPALPDDWNEIASHLGYQDGERAASDIQPYAASLMERWDSHNRQDPTEK